VCARACTHVDILALVIWHENFTFSALHYSAICSLPSSATFFHITKDILRGEGTNQKNVFWFSLKHLILWIQRDIIINVCGSSRKGPIICHILIKLWIFSQIFKTSNINFMKIHPCRQARWSSESLSANAPNKIQVLNKIYTYCYCMMRKAAKIIKYPHSFKCEEG
jgi:hypothetical protein